MKHDAPFQIVRTANPDKGFDFSLIEVSTGKLVCAEWRCKSPIPPLLLREHQARLNTQAVLDHGYWLHH